MKHVTFPSNVQYAGADVSPRVIAKNIAAYPNRSFFVADLVEDDFDFKIFDNGAAGDNKKTVPDLIFVRALVWHLPIEDNLRLLKRLQNSNARYVMLSTRLRADRNNASFIPAMGKLSRLVLYYVFMFSWPLFMFNCFFFISWPLFVSFRSSHQFVSCSILFSRCFGNVERR
jgi:hypothetical protein